MSDPHGNAGANSGAKIDLIPWGIGLFFFFLFVVFFYFSPEYAKYFTIVLNIIQAICVLAIVFMLYKLWYFMQEFSANGAAIVKNYENKLKHHHPEENDEKNLVRGKYNLAMEYLNSKNEEEWLISLVELDNFIRLSLLGQGYSGETTLELIKDAKEKGHKHIKIAESIALLRQLQKSKGPNFDYPRENFKKLVKKFEDFKDTILTK